MGKIGKPQRSQKHKKIKACDPFYKGDRKGVRSIGLNQVPKNFDQEVPKSLRRLGYVIQNSKSDASEKKSKNKFLSTPKGQVKYHNKFTTPMGSDKNESQGKGKQGQSSTEKTKKKWKDKAPKHSVDRTPQVPDGKQKKSKLKKEDIEEYIDNLKPTRTFVEPFKFKQRKDESSAKFMRRVNEETKYVIAKSKLDDQYDESDEKKIAKIAKQRSKSNEKKKKQRLADKKKLKVEALKEKKREQHTGFNALKDKVEFGEVVHAPPTLSVLPKKAAHSDGVDKPGRRMPELKEAINRNIAESMGYSQEVTQQSQRRNIAESMGKGQGVTHQRQRGKTVKRKLMSSGQQIIADNRRSNFIEAYRSIKLKKAKLK